MSLRWLRRIFWLILLAVLVIAPARLAQAPAPAQASPAGPNATDAVAAAAPFTSISPTLIIGSIIILLTLGAVALRNHRTCWRP